MSESVPDTVPESVPGTVQEFRNARPDICPARALRQRAAARRYAAFMPALRRRRTLTQPNPTAAITTTINQYSNVTSLGRAPTHRNRGTLGGGQPPGGINLVHPP